MALIKCPECGRENVSDTALACPGCGYGIREHFFKISENNIKETMLTVSSESSSNNSDKEDKAASFQEFTCNIKSSKCEKIDFEENKGIIDVQTYEGEKGTVSEMIPSEYEKIDSVKYKEYQNKFGTKFLVIILILIGVVGVICIKNNLKTNTDSSNSQESVSKEIKDEEDINAEKLETAKILMAEGKYQEAESVLRTLDVYENSKELLKQCLYEQALDKYEAKQYVDSYVLLRDKVLEQHEPSLELRRSIKNDHASEIDDIINKSYTDNDYEKTIYYLELFKHYSELNGSDLYKNAVFMNSIQGNYISPVSTRRATVQGNIFTADGKSYTITPVEEEQNIGGMEVVGRLNGNAKHRLRLIEVGEIWVINGSINDDWDVWETQEFYDKNQERIAKIEAERKANEPKPPAIGMTADEVEKSTWGKPFDINKTTYSWGTHEQWCYDDYKYIYLENGVVTAISE